MSVNLAERAPLISYFPDGHMVVKHMYGIAKYKLSQAIYTIGSLLWAANWAQQLLHLRLRHMGAVHTVARDVDSLALIYKEVATPAGQMCMGPDGRLPRSAGRDWAPKKFR